MYISFGIYEYRIAIPLENFSEFHKHMRFITGYNAPYKEDTKNGRWELSVIRNEDIESTNPEVLHINSIMEENNRLTREVEKLRIELEKLTPKSTDLAIQ